MVRTESIDSVIYRQINRNIREAVWEPIWGIYDPRMQPLASLWGGAFGYIMRVQGAYAVEDDVQNRWCEL